MKKLRHRGVRLLGGGHTAQMRGSLPEHRAAGLWKEMVGMGEGAASSPGRRQLLTLSQVRGEG